MGLEAVRSKRGFVVARAWEMGLVARVQSRRWEKGMGTGLESGRADADAPAEEIGAAFGGEGEPGVDEGESHVLELLLKAGRFCFFRLLWLWHTYLPVLPG